MKLHKRKKANGCNWVYWKKEALSENESEKFKTQLVAKDYSNTEEENASDMLTKPVPASSGATWT